ncbi:MAG: hypothetical protein PHD65_00615 [Gallionella sp.]|nr:hypothetical protein [Gallionella sp.]
MRISIATPDYVGKMEAMECGWIYADEDLETFRLVRDTLEKPYPAVSAEVFQQTALDLQAPFVRWVDECMSTAPCDYWLATPLSKNPFESPLFLHLVWMVLIDRTIKQGMSGIIVVTESHGLALAFAELCRIRNWECKRYGKINSLFRHWRRNLTALPKWLGKLLLLGYRVSVAKCIFTDKYVATRLITTELLLETYIHDGNMDRDGGCKERYFPNLMAYYRAHGVKAGYFPLLHHIPFSHLRQTYAFMKRSETPFVPFEAFITLWDITLAGWASIRHGQALLLKTPLVFQDVPVSALVRTECFTAGLRSVMPFAMLRAPRRMAEAGIKPKWFIDWFENQSLDKGIVLGIKKGLPECHTIAVRQYAPLSNFLSLFSSSGEVNAGVAPIENWVCGEALKSMFTRFDTLGKYFAVPALRYAYLHQSPPALEACDTLLILLTHSVEESMGILDCVIPLCREKGMDISRFVAKVHPDMNLALFKQKVEQRFASLGRNTIEWSDCKVGELFQTARVVVTSGSSTAVEAVCRGIPVALVGRHAGLNFNPLEGINTKIWTIVYTPYELKTAITQQFCEERLPSTERFTIAKNTQNTFFMKTGAAEMRRFLPTELKIDIL